MDSKYASLDASKTNGVKKNKSASNIKVKQSKTNHGNTTASSRNKVKNKKQNGANKETKKATEVKQTAENKQNGSTSETEQETEEKQTAQQLQEARKQLPVYKLRKSLIDEIKKNKTMIIIGETGSGKTTQIPQLLLERHMEGTGTIAVTQPRRVAAITIALRVAAESNTTVGSTVGYSVRFEDVTSSETKLKYLTDGMLLREAMVDPLLLKYSIIVLDEAHERTVSTDVLFGIVKLAQKKRCDKMLSALRIIIMSATMDVDTFKEYFDDCTVIYLEGRTFPVTIHHTKVKHDDYQHAALSTLFQLHKDTPADQDFLVFLTGEEEIEAVMHNIKQIAQEFGGPPIRVCPLYASLPAAKQLQVWQPAPVGTRKIVLSTNIAEASVTIPGIRIVIDSGLVKERSWCGNTGAERLSVHPCSQAAGWQRAGRAGRTAPGTAYRLYTAADFKARPTHTAPEIVRCPLSTTLLQLITTGADPATFPLIDAPPADSLKASLALLKELGAIHKEYRPKLTQLGKKMSRFPLDPKYSKVLLSAPAFGCLEEVLSIIAVLSSENIFYTPMNKREEAFKVKQKFVSPLGDHITLLNVYKAYCKAPLKKQWCRDNYFDRKNLAHAFEVRQQLSSICQNLDIFETSCGEAYEQVLKCLLCGLYTNCAWLRGGVTQGQSPMSNGRYVTASGSAVGLHPSGTLHSMRPSPPMLLYTDLLHTNRTYMITASVIQPQWLHQVAPEYARKCRAYR